MVEVGRLSAPIEVDGLSGFTSDLGRARSEAEQTGAAVDEALDVDTSEAQASIGGLGDRLSGLGAGFAVAGGAAAAAGVAIVGSALSSGRELRGLSQAARLNVEDLQAMGAVARQTGGDVEDIADASRELQLRLAEATSLGTGPAVDALNLLGLSIADIQNLNPEESFALIRDRLSEIEDPARRAFLAEELLGGSTERLTGFIEANAEAFRGQIEAVRESGAVISGEAVAANAAAADAIDIVTSSVSALASELVANLSPALVTASGAITTVTGALQDNSEAARESDLRAHFLAEAMDIATQSTTTLSFGTVGLKGEYEDLDAQIDILLGANEAQVEVYGRLAAVRAAATTEVEVETTAVTHAALAWQAYASARALGRPSFTSDTTSPRDRAFSGAVPSQFVTGTSRELVSGIAPGEPLPVRLVIGGGRGGGGRGDPVTQLTAEEIAAETETRDRERFFEQIDALYAGNRINDDQYEALIESNDLGMTLAGLVEGASRDELSALGQVRTSLFRLGELDAQGSRSIVQAIEALGASLSAAARGRSSNPYVRRRFGEVTGINAVEVTGNPLGFTASQVANFAENARRRNTPEGRRAIADATGGFDPVSINVNVMVDGETLASGQVGEVQRALNRGEITVHAQP